MKAADRRGLTCMQEKTKHHLFFFYLHKLSFAAAIKDLFFPVDFKSQLFWKFLSQVICWYALGVWYSYHWIFKRKIHFLSCSGKHVYSSCTDAGWFRLTCHTCCRQQQEKPLSLIIHIFNKVKRKALSKLTFSTAKSWAKYKYLHQDKELITWACKQEYLLENADSRNNPFKFNAIKPTR